jgi:hypothetical protein
MTGKPACQAAVLLLTCETCAMRTTPVQELLPLLCWSFPSAGPACPLASSRAAPVEHLSTIGLLIVPQRACHPAGWCTWTLT